MKVKFMKASRDIRDLVKIMSALRTPKTGCPWDLEQDFRSIAPYTIEEAYEVADAIERDDMEDLRLELGDLLLQSVYHAQMASEDGHFDFGDVVEGISNKMIRRHPHVFGTQDVTAAEYSAKGMQQGTWERIKAEEKAEAAQRRIDLGLAPKSVDTSLLSSVPRNLPALVEALKLQARASSVGFDWNDPQAVLDKVCEEAAEFTEAAKTNDAAASTDELGDLLFTVVNLARHFDIDPEMALRDCNRKFRRRFGHIETRAKDSGQEMADMDLEQLEALWTEAKQLEKTPDV